MGFELPSRQPRALAADEVAGKAHEDVLQEDVVEDELHELEPAGELGRLQPEPDLEQATQAEMDVDSGLEIEAGPDLEVPATPQPQGA